MSDDAPQALMIESLKNTGEALELTWSDQAVHTIPWTVLRKLCPCASCRLERAQPPAPEPQSALPILSASEAQPLKPTRVEPMGHYAYSINFNDGHNSGIYTLSYLRELGRQLEG